MNDFIHTIGGLLQLQDMQPAPDSHERLAKFAQAVGVSVPQTGIAPSHVPVQGSQP